jgi:hypothetical protein
MLPGLAGISGFGVIKPTTVTYQAFASSNSALQTYSFASQAFGTASTDRVIIVYVAAENSGTISSATIGGISATILVQQTSGAVTAGIIAAAVPTGTTGTVAVTMAGTATSCGVGIWSSTGLSGAVATATGSNANLDALTLNVDSGGFVIAGCINNDDERDATWAGATEVFDDGIDEDVRVSAASDRILVSSVTVQPTLGGAASPVVLVAATF